MHYCAVQHFQFVKAEVNCVERPENKHHLRVHIYQASQRNRTQSRTKTLLWQSRTESYLRNGDVLLLYCFLTVVVLDLTVVQFRMMKVAHFYIYALVLY